jgi:ABC-type transporter lipoprotein component MlaA
LLDLDPILQQQLDPYLFIREAYLQKRRAEILESGAPLVDSVIDIEKELFND